MSPNTTLAFDSLDARARATPSDQPLDRISLRDHVVEVEIGAFQVERGTTQRVSFDVVVEVLPISDPLDDDVDRILSYDTISQAIAFELGSERLNLLETLAERIGERILAEPLAQRVFVRIQKLDRGPGALGVEIVRSKTTTLEKAKSDDVSPNPVVVFLSNAALSSPKLTRWIDELTGQDAPVVLCMGPPDLITPKTGMAMTQKRIDLLAIEQNAWVLASRDDRCVVVESRTELDWAARQGKLSVWAPSRIVLDGIDGPGTDIGDGTDLAVWFAELVEASRLIFVGAEPDVKSKININTVSEDAENIT